MNYSCATVYLDNISTEFNTRDKHLPLSVVNKKAITKKWLDKNPQTKGEWIAVVKKIYDGKTDLLP